MEWTKKNRRTVIAAGCVTLVVLCLLWVVTHREQNPLPTPAAEPPALSAEDAFQMAVSYHIAHHPELDGYAFQERRTLPAADGYTVSFRQEGFLFTYQVTGALGAVSEGETDYHGTLPDAGWRLPDPPGMVEREPEVPLSERPLPEGVPEKDAEHWALVRTALVHAGVDESAVEAWDAAYEYDGETPMCWKVRFRAAGTDYGYELGLDGKTILAWERNTASEDPPERAEEPSHTLSDIGEAQAKAAALEAAGVDMASVRWLRARRVRENEDLWYEVSFELGGKTYRYTVDAASGKVLE